MQSASATSSDFAAFFGTDEDLLPRSSSSQIDDKTSSDDNVENVEERCVISLDRRCYDVTSFIDSHPGGRENLWRYCGRDATEAFDVFGHSKGAHDFMRRRLLVFCAAAFCGKRGRPMIDRYHHRRLVDRGRRRGALLLSSLLAFVGGDRSSTVLVFVLVPSLCALVAYHSFAAAVWFLVAGRALVSLMGCKSCGFQTLWNELSASSMRMQIISPGNTSVTAGVSIPIDSVAAVENTVMLSRDLPTVLLSSSSEDEALGASPTNSRIKQRRRRRRTPSERKQRLLQHIEHDFSVTDSWMIC